MVSDKDTCPPCPELACSCSAENPHKPATKFVKPALAQLLEKETSGLGLGGLTGRKQTGADGQGGGEFPRGPPVTSAVPRKGTQTGSDGKGLSGRRRAQKEQDGNTRRAGESSTTADPGA
ncbi:hypothetical protein H920_06603 [Fukomys damarensis]|uniref:Uncharacterized protein n=1 Tax=Fukomys damarensis TaxID=885580 RepID=A0A091DIS0_FUKDA|nr:hypothetical protein H920_06603 [Fukomys damarensis]